MSLFLVLNAGSSSIKYKVLDKDSLDLKISGVIEEIGTQAAKYTHKELNGQNERNIEGNRRISNHEEAISLVIELLESESGVKCEDIAAVGHRVVHGGDIFKEAAIIDHNVMKQLENLVPLAPLHNPPSISGIKAAKKKFPVMHIADFDTAFHCDMPSHSRRYGLPEAWISRYKIYRYGMHGISHGYLAKECAFRMGKDISTLKLVTLHLGRGCSICAIEGGKSVDTSMGFTPLEGMIMGTRCGDIDPSVVFRIMESGDMSPNEIESTLNHESGLKDICGTGDFRQIFAKLNMSGNSETEMAKLAFDMFCYRAAKYVGSYFVSLGGIDALVFSGGIGEHLPEVRSEICRYLKCIGVEIDDEMNKNALKTGEASAIQKYGMDNVQVWVIATNEELEIAKEMQKKFPK